MNTGSSEAALVPGPTEAPAGSRDALVDYLQRMGDKYDGHIELLRRQQELQAQKALTFKPALTQRAYALEKKSLARRSEPIEQRLHHLHAKKLAREAAKQAAHEREREAAVAQYTFQPQLTSYAASLKRPGTIEANAQWEAQRAARHAAMVAQGEAEACREVTGAPTITAYAQEKASAERPDGIPIEDLLLWREQQRRQRLYAAAQAQLTRRSLDTSLGSGADDGLTAPTKPFEPSISQYAARYGGGESSSAAGAGVDASAVVERLYRPHDAARRVFDEEYALHCTFHPAISAASQELSQLYYDDATMHGVDEDVHGRLYANVTKPSKYRKDTVEVPTWRPTLSAGSQRILERRKNSAGAGLSPASRLHRTGLHHQPETRRFAKPVVTPRDVEDAAACTHHPHVNPKSEALWARQVEMLCAKGHARNPDEAREMLWRRAEKRREEAVQRSRQLQEREAREECTFAPKAGRPPRRQIGGPGLGLADRTELWAQQREHKLEEARAEKDEQEAAECAFHPHVDPVFPLPSERSRRRQAPGVAAFLERQEEARRRRAEVAQWLEPRNGQSRPPPPPRSSSSASHSRSSSCDARPSASSIAGTDPQSMASHEARRTSLARRAVRRSTSPRVREVTAAQEANAYAVGREDEDEEDGLEVASSNESFPVHRRSDSQRGYDAHVQTYADLPFRPVPAPPKMVRPSVLVEGSPVAAMLSRQRATLEEY